MKKLLQKKKKKFPGHFIDQQVKEILTCKKLNSCENVNLKVVFLPFKVRYLFSIKESILKYRSSFVVYRFPFHGCNTSNIGDTTRHLTPRIKQHLETD